MVVLTQTLLLCMPPAVAPNGPVTGVAYLGGTATASTNFADQNGWVEGSGGWAGVYGRWVWAARLRRGGQAGQASGGQLLDGWSRG